MKHSRTIVLGIVVAASVSCGGSDSGTGPGPGSVSITVSVSPTGPGILLGETRKVVARDGNGIDLGGVTWSTSAAGVATVSQTGVLTAVGEGPATITATAGGSSGSLTISVFALTFASVATGGAHTCALTTTGAAYCWGRGESGQLGVGAVSALRPCLIGEQNYPCSAIPVAVQAGLAFAHIEAGSTHTCGITTTGTAYCWGLNNAGQLGDSSTTGRFDDQKQTPARVAGSHAFVSISAAALHTCALTAAGAAYCWGSNTRGQLGDGTTTNRGAPVAVGGGLSFVKITTGGYGSGLTCGLVASGAAYCWGGNFSGQIGMGTTDNVAHAAPAPVAGGIAFATVAAGTSHSCGLTSAGSGYCWGENVLGSLGDGTTQLRAAPVTVSGGLTFAQVAAGGFSSINAHTCGLTSTGQAYCWGDNEAGALGDASLASKSIPSAVAGRHAFKSMDAGYRHTCAVATTGILYCWGSNGAGQLGLNLFAVQSSPTRVLGQR